MLWQRRRREGGGVDGARGGRAVLGEEEVWWAGLGGICVEQKAAAGLELGEIDGCFGWWPVFVAEMAGEIWV